MFYQTLFSISFCRFQSQSARADTSDLQDFSFTLKATRGGREVGCYLHMYRCQLDHVYTIANLR